MGLSRRWVLLAAVAACTAIWAADPLPVLDPNRAEFPDSSLVDFGALTPRHTAQQGFMRTDREGRFVWENGQRARFWGINVASDSVFQAPERIETCLQRIRRAGFNLVRIHHIDGTGRGIILGQKDSTTWDETKLRALDYWVDRCGQLGISVYLDLLDYRTFHSGDGIPNAEMLGRGAKPYALFDEALINLQKRYAKALLRDHINSYNGKCFADDSAVVMVELFDENGLFIRRRDWGGLAEPYRTTLRRRWNDFLLDRYGSTEALAAAWGRSGVNPPFSADQRLEQGSVALPTPALSPDSVATTVTSKLERAIGSDAARFAHRVHRAYYRSMRDFLRREVRLRVPISAVGDFSVVPDLLSVVQELDFVGTNFYWDHPVFRAGRPWQYPYIFHYWNALGSTNIEGFGPVLALSRMSRKPLVVREWNYCFPNPYRSGGMVEAAAYAALQDVDAMILFTYGTLPQKRSIGWFDCQADPSRWGLAGITGAAFLQTAVSPAKYRIELGHSDVDTFLFKSYETEVRNLAYVSRVATRCFDRQLAPDADLTIASGRSGAAEYANGPLLLLRNDPSVTTAGDSLEQTSDHFGYPLGLSSSGGGSYVFDGLLLSAAGPVWRGSGSRFALSAIQSLGLRAVGQGTGDAVGYWDPARKIAGFGALNETETVRVALDMLNVLYQAPVGRDDCTNRRFRSDTGELLRDSNRGQLQINTPRYAAVAGDLRGGPYQLGALRLETSTTIGAVTLFSLDGLPLSECKRFVMKAVSQAGNTGMVASAPGPQNNPSNRWIVDSEGVSPVRTGGRAQLGGLRVYRGTDLWFQVDLAEGTVELVHDAGGWRWWTDTPDARVTVPGAEKAWALGVDGRVDELPMTLSGLPYPERALLVRAE
ncbi:MAG: hypothetical protein HZB16_15025 [Armatimonadetes bacterium]|nr:hypothetical protein [Armatimonadota bacterium]